MKFILVLLILVGNSISAQVSLLGAKPKISINGNLCAILNQQYSCTPRTCDSITIDAGDIINFCTVDQIDLTSDTAYYMQWDFNGSSNYASPFFDFVPSITPICYSPQWNVPGNYVVDIFYNGWLSAYSWSDCFSYGPSHWIINVSVMSTNGTFDASQNFKIDTYPNPSKNNFTIETNENRNFIVHITNPLGQKIVEKKFLKKIEVGVSSFGKGLFLIEICDEKGKGYHAKKILLE